MAVFIDLGSDHYNSKPKGSCRYLLIFRIFHCGQAMIWPKINNSRHDPFGQWPEEFGFDDEGAEGE